MAVVGFHAISGEFSSGQTENHSCTKVHKVYSKEAKEKY
jgi:hypothetical protein